MKTSSIILAATTLVGHSAVYAADTAVAETVIVDSTAATTNEVQPLQKEDRDLKWVYVENGWNGPPPHGGGWSNNDDWNGSGKSGKGSSDDSWSNGGGWSKNDDWNGSSGKSDKGTDDSWSNGDDGWSTSGGWDGSSGKSGKSTDD